MKKIKTKKRSISNTLSDVTKQYLVNLNSLHETTPEIIEYLLNQYKSINKEFTGFIDSKGKKSIRNGKTIYTLKPEYTIHARKLYKHREIRRKSLKNTSNSLFVSMCSNYEVFISDFIRILLPIIIGTLSSNDGESLKINQQDNPKSLTYAEILSHGSIKSIREKILDIELEKFTRKSYVEQIKWIETKFQIDIRKYLPRFNKFIEVSKRRNLCVHNDGKIDRSYFENQNKYEIKLKISELKDKRFYINKNYISRCYSILIETGIVITSLIWRKILNKKKDIELADLMLNSEICYQLLLGEEYALAKTLLDFSHSIISKKSSPTIKSTCEINIALCHKFLGNTDEMKEMLDKLTIPKTKRDIYKLAIYVITDKYKDASELMCKLSRKNNFVETQYREFPLFKDFRNTQEFKNAFKKVFKKEYTEDFTIINNHDIIQP